mgnify:CR=1 FL=1
MIKRLNFVLYAFIYKYIKPSPLKLDQTLDISPGEEKKHERREKGNKGKVQLGRKVRVN